MVAEALGCPRNMLLMFDESIEEWMCYFMLKAKNMEMGGAKDEAARGSRSVKKSLFGR